MTRLCHGRRYRMMRIVKVGLRWQDFVMVDGLK